MKLEGTIDEIELVPALVELGRQKFTGAIRFEADGIIKIIYLKNGDILSASTNDRPDSIDEILLRSGKVNREHVRQALAKRKESETLGDALLGLGFVSRKELVWARRLQVVGILRSILQWREGSYTVVQDYLPKREEGTAYYLNQIVLELLVTEEDRVAVERALDGGDAVLEKTPHFNDLYRTLGLNQEADEIVDRIDGRKSVSEIAAASPSDSFALFKLMQALHVLGLLTKPESTTIPPAEEPAWEPPAFDEGGPELNISMSEPLRTSEHTTTDDRVILPPLDLSLQADVEEGAAVEEIAQTRDVLTIDSDPESPLDERSTERPRRSRLAVAVTALLLVAAAVLGFNYWRNGKSARPPFPVQPRPAAARAPEPTVSTQPSVTESLIESPQTEFQVAGDSPVSTSEPEQPPSASSPKPKTSVRKESRPTKGLRIEQSPSGAVSMTNMDGRRSEPRTDDPARARYDAMATAFARNSRATGYAVQFALVCQTESVTKSLANGGDNLWFVPIAYRGRSCFRLLWGRYDRREDADAAVGTIPAGLRAGGAPAVVKIEEVVQR